MNPVSAASKFYVSIVIVGVVKYKIFFNLLNVKFVATCSSEFSVSCKIKFSSLSRMHLWKKFNGVSIKFSIIIS